MCPHLPHHGQLSQDASCQTLCIAQPSETRFQIQQGTLGPRSQSANGAAPKWAGHVGSGGWGGRGWQDGLGGVGVGTPGRAAGPPKGRALVPARGLLDVRLLQVWGSAWVPLDLRIPGEGHGQGLGLQGSVVGQLVVMGSGSLEGPVSGLEFWEGREWGSGPAGPARAGPWCDLGLSPHSLTSMGSLAYREDLEEENSGARPGSGGVGRGSTELSGRGGGLRRPLTPTQQTQRGAFLGLQRVPHLTTET